jgi:hypothetical protein
VAQSPQHAAQKRRINSRADERQTMNLRDTHEPPSNLAPITPLP